MMYQETFKGYSPWGGIQHSKVIAKGLKMVGTAGHGGYMATNLFAEKFLSKACAKNADIYNNYLCYEEDCHYKLLEFDLLNNHPKIFADKLLSDKNDLEEAKKSLLEDISGYKPQYLIELGIEPSKEHYKRFLEREEYDRLRAKRDPNLIISAIIDKEIDKEIIKVKTADGKCHYVTNKSYSKLQKETVLLLLSKCDVVAV